MDGCTELLVWAILGHSKLVMPGMRRPSKEIAYDSMEIVHKEKSWRKRYTAGGGVRGGGESKGERDGAE